MEKIKKLISATGWKKILIISILILSFALTKSFNPISIYSANGFLLSTLFILGYGIFGWLLFEILVGFFYSGLKSKVENFISIKEFTNIFRIVFIFVNILTFGITDLCVLINFYTPFLILFLTIIISFVAMWMIYKFLVKFYIGKIGGKEMSLTYFSFVFIYLFLMTIMWGSV